MGPYTGSASLWLSGKSEALNPEIRNLETEENLYSREWFNLES